MTLEQQRTVPPLRELRKSRNLSIDVVAFMAKVHKSSISRFERGLIDLPDDAVVRLCQALKVRPERIVGG